MQQNDVPLIKRLCISNGTETLLDNVVVEITCEPEFAGAWRTHVAVVPANGAYDLGKIDLALSAGYLAQLTERILGKRRGYPGAGGYGGLFQLAGRPD
jgi:hypothetical protein